MFIVDVAPLKNSRIKQPLSYLCPKSVMPGQLVTIPLRKKLVKAIVINIYDASNLAKQLRTSGIRLRSVTGIHQLLVDPAFIVAAEKTSRAFMTPINQIINAMIPEKLASIGVMNNAFLVPRHLRGTKRNSNKSFIQSSYTVRLDSYYQFMNRKDGRTGTYICVPTIPEAKVISKDLKERFNIDTVVLYGELTELQFKNLIEELAGSSRVYNFVGTAKYFSVASAVVNRLIIERDHHDNYERINYPIFDERYFLEKFCEERDVSLLLGATIFDINRIHAFKEERYSPLRKYTYKIDTTSNRVISKKLDLKAGQPKENGIIYRTTMDIIEQALKADKKVLVISNKNATASIVSCRDCHTTFTCKGCGKSIPLLPKNTTGFIYQCNFCGNSEKAVDICRNCGGSRLTLSGVTSSAVFAELAGKFGSEHVFLVDKKLTNKTLNEIKSSEGKVIVSTPSIQKHIIGREILIDTTVILGLDTYLNLPSYQATASVLRHIFDLAQYIPNVVIQKNHTPDIFLRAFYDANLIDWYHYEIDIRKSLGYPPFNTLIEINIPLKSNQKEIATELDRLLVKIENTYSWWSYNQIKSEGNTFNIRILVKKNNDLDSLEKIKRYKLIRQLFANLPEKSRVKINVPYY